jgi:hypothetical protein
MVSIVSVSVDFVCCEIRIPSISDISRLIDQLTSEFLIILSSLSADRDGLKWCQTPVCQYSVYALKFEWYQTVTALLYSVTVCLTSQLKRGVD